MHDVTRDTLNPISSDLDTRSPGIQCKLSAGLQNSFSFAQVPLLCTTMLARSEPFLAFMNRLLHAGRVYEHDVPDELLQTLLRSICFLSFLLSTKTLTVRSFFITSCG